MAAVAERPGAVAALPVAPAEQPGHAVQQAGKRLLDIVGASCALCALSPLLFASALAIKLTSPGPTLYRWPVVGQGGRPLVSYKFRTMVINADALKADLLAQNEMRGPVFKMKNDPRVTRIGKLLRKLSIDELPQLVSVLQGDLSLVGPRPPLQSEYRHFTPEQRRKLQVKPGLTCLWQISGRNRIVDFEEWLALDLAYIRDWNLLLDIKILLATIPAVLRGAGAS
jgi:lipopolysaccharide/colanic/teichoic acid biosynthesis glycosyltransferase